MKDLKRPLKALIDPWEITLNRCHYSTNSMNAKKELIDITRTSKRGTSLRITLPKRIAEKLLIKEGEFLGFYGEGDKVIVERIA